MRNLVFCADGTWNSDDDNQKLTNVHRISTLAKSTIVGDVEQITEYRSGVGTGSLLDKLIGGGFGRGLDDNIKDGYRWLSEHYQLGDRIFLFGFSRGAYTVRSLVGLINRKSLMKFTGSSLSDAAKTNLVDQAFSTYRKRLDEEPDMSDLELFHDTPEIHFLGVWDTVGARGIPDEVAIVRDIVGDRRYKFHDTKLSTIVKTARHAVAIDESRKTFTPTLWTDDPSKRDLKQIWFAGVHSNVGGGYANRELSDIALEWMLNEAKAVGLLTAADPDLRSTAEPLGKLEDSMQGAFAKLQSRPRSVPNFNAPNAAEIFSASALKRHKELQGYWPTTNLAIGEEKTFDVSSEVHWHKTPLYLEKGGQYKFSASGTWQDGMKVHGPAGVSDDDMQWGHKVGDWWDKVQNYLTEDDADPSTWSPAKRERDFPWFALIGVIANGEGVDEEVKDIIDHKSFLIGNGANHVPEVGGYLYCFANDAWKFYGGLKVSRNAGSVALTVRRLA